MGRIVSKPDREPRGELGVVLAAPELGLTAEQVEERRRRGLVNTPVDPPGKTVGQIFVSNICTWFNLVFLFLGLCVALVGSWSDLMFLGVVVWNAAIGIVQELRSKRVLDRLNLVTAQRCTAVRDGAETEVPGETLVRDDVVIFRGGEQICADAEVLSGSCRVNEALVTGEADEVTKEPGDRLLSGSFVVNGACRARLTAVGAESYASRLTIAARKGEKSREPEMMRDLGRLVKWIGIGILPFGALLFWKELALRQGDLAGSVVGTVGALVGMIPEGLYLLTSLALAAGVLRLARRRTLVHELKSIETLARVDVLCVDKTGTITEPEMAVEELTPLNGAEAAETEALLADYVRAAGGENDTMRALAARYREGAGREAAGTLPFSSANKYGAVAFTDGKTLYLGAPEVLLGARYEELRERSEAYAERGCRVLLLAEYAGALDEKTAPAPGLLRPLALIALRNPIRPAAAETFRYFASQGVAVRVISGDNPLTVSQIARAAGIEGAERYVDARELNDPAQYAEALERNTVFGRVTPEQKREFVRALKAAGHTVAMTGDGVNDVLALKEADCSAAMASGSDAAGRVSDLVLLDNDFSVMPGVVAEGRRVINNIERSATLFLVKNIVSLLLSLASLLFRLPYPFAPVQMTLIGMLTIGFPAFVLALEPNGDRIRGRFLRNVLTRAVPPALTDFALIAAAVLIGGRLGLSGGAQSTVAVCAMSAVGLLVIVRLCRPFTRVRAGMLALILIGFALAFCVLPGWFRLELPGREGLPLLAGLLAAAYPLLLGLTKLWDRATGR